MRDAESEQLRERFRHTLWIGGGSGSGKSTVVRQLAANLDISVYATDDVMAAHGRRIDHADTPFLAAFAAMNGDERWVTRSPEVMFETFHWFRGEAFDLIVADLLARPEDAGVIVEGFRLLPHLVSPLLTSPAQAVWLLPTPELRQLAFESRRPTGAPWSFIEMTSDPARALSNLLERDRMFTEHLAVEAAEFGLHTIRIDVKMKTDDVAALVADWFGL